MLHHKPRSLLVRVVREIFYKIQYPIRRLYWYVFRPTRYGVKTFIFNKDRFVLVKLGYGRKLWYLPGGGIERSETPARAAIREVNEETGLRLDEVVYVDKRVYDSQYKINHVDYFYAETNQIDLTIDDQEVIDAGWFTIDDLPQDTPSITKEELELLKNWKHARQK